MASASFFAKICTSLRSVLKFFNAHHSRFAYVLHMAPIKCDAGCKTLNFCISIRTRNAPIQICRETSVKKFLKRSEVEQEF